MNKFIRFILYTLVVLLLLTGILATYVIYSGKVDEPFVADTSAMNLSVDTINNNLIVIGNNWIHKSKSGLYEMYVAGKPYERGVINGKLARGLIHEQEAAFSEQIDKMVPSDFYKHFLKYLIGWFNRDLNNNLTEESKLEIYGVSRAASHDYDYVGPAYQRMMNYHAAHDIGHALQNLALVGCSSFATWGDKSENNDLIVGRNFDFYVGDRFAKNKIIQFTNPDSGYKFMMVTWGGMTGVVSGMNIKGLTITLNAAKSEIPSGSATPVSLLAREILQYASNIEEALKIASGKKVFVSETFLIASAIDHKAVSIELSPEKIAVYDPGTNQIICTNHFESELLGNTSLNQKHLKESASLYRYNRIKELLDTVTRNNPSTTAAILRDQLGQKNKFIGYGNEKAINQLICHHSIIFKPDSLVFLISTGPWQLGNYVAYRLDDIFAMKGLHSDMELTDTSLTIPADSFLISNDYKNFLKFLKYKNEISEGMNVDINSFYQTNPEFYHTNVIAGDYEFKRNNYKKAAEYYSMALKKEIATKSESDYIEDQLKLCKEKTK